ncbi:flagellar hook-length control protein FliK [Caulobacter segnis]|uniref:flagellar hook-length control protein FliK n=1 Tax=Caulobacter segnis TaxID=88688 RepID=UPI0028590C30|nr:flagellar hook-length control protein FliK [Caulobacter segnis]MDR6625438.1 hypothetical protein [Caulobacter segnis]
MAIDPTAPLTPMTPAAPPGSQPHSVVLQAMARAALANVTNTLGGLAGGGATEAAKPHQGVEQPDKASTRDAGHAAVSFSSGGGVPGASASRPPPQETRLMRAVRVAVADAVPRQAGLAPLMADVRAVLDWPDTPPEVRIAGENLMARLPRAFEVSTARGLKKAVERSGVFLEARLARSATSAPDGQASPVSPGADLKAALLVFKGALSGWLARAAPPPVEELEDAVIVAEQPAETAEVAQPAKPSLPLPTPPPRQGPEAAPRKDTPSTPPAALEVSPDEPERAALPANSMKAQPLQPDAEDTAPPPRAAAAEAGEAGQDDVEPRFAAFLAPLKSTSQTPSAKPVSAVLGFLDLAEVSPEPDDGRPPPPAATPLAARGYGGTLADPAAPKTPPPPFAGGPMAGQRPKVTELPAHAAPDEIVRRLLRGASAALARQDLMQIASLREVHHDPETGEARPQPSRLNLDVPFVTLEGVAVAQFEITRDGGGAGGGVVGPVERTYRARFSIDVEPLGPVHALVTLTGARARVSLWAERAETIARLRAGEEALGAALRQAELTPEVAVHSGPPPVKDGRALGHFVDQAS